LKIKTDNRINLLRFFFTPNKLINAVNPHKTVIGSIIIPIRIYPSTGSPDPPKRIIIKVITVGSHGNVNPVQKIPMRRILRCLNLKYLEIIISPMRMEIAIATKLKLLCNISIGVRAIKSH
jgi:hypothetical protein